MESFLSDVPCLSFSCCEDGTILQVNNRLCEKTGYSRDELTGRKIDFLFTLATRIFQQTHFFPLLKMQGYAEEIYITLKTKDNQELPLLINAVREIREDKAIIIYAGIIVHQRKKFEDELLAAKKAAEAALNENTALQKAKQELQNHAEQLDEQMYLVSKQHEELKQFNRVVTHDLQEPLRKLFIFTNLLQENKDDSETVFKAVEKIKKVSEQMRSLLSGLQQFVWLTETKVKAIQVNLNKLLLVVREQLEKEYPGITISIQAEELDIIEADWEQMQLLLYQVLNNAIRFRKTEDAVQVQVWGNTLQLNKFRKSTNKYKYTDFLKLQIKDHGMGFDNTYKEQVFELFKRLHPESGRGVGLSLCKKIVENHEGSISINSTVEEGTTVTILLPLWQETSAETFDENTKTSALNDN